MRAPPETRPYLAGALTACACFLAAAAVDWTWELGVIPIVFLGAAAVVIGAGRTPEARRGSPRSRSRGTLARYRPYAGRAAMGTIAIGSIVAIALPLSGTIDLSDSRASAAQGQVKPAFEEASAAAGAQPYAASPPLQQALLLERAENLPAAAQAAAEATRDEPTNWRTWLIRSRIEAKAGNAPASVEAFRTARKLNPNSYSIASAEALAEQQIAAEQLP
jgi:tetratricopeptide (TPR) repeat protein